MVVLTTRIFFRFNSIFFPVEWYSFAWQLMKFLQIIMSMYEVPTWGLSYSTSFTLFLFNPVNYPVKEILCPLYWLGGWGLERWRTWFKLTQYRSSRSGTQIQWDSDLGVSFHYPIPGRLPTISFVCFLPFPLSCLLYIPKHYTCLKINPWGDRILQVSGDSQSTVPLTTCLPPSKKRENWSKNKHRTWRTGVEVRVTD